MTRLRVVAAWDVVVVGAGPAGLAAASAAARAGARTLVVEKAEHPRYKTCGGGLIATSLSAVPDATSVPVRDQVDRATFTLDGRREFTRGSSSGALVSMVQRDEFDDALRRAAVGAGVVVRQRTPVRAIEQDDSEALVRLAGGDEMTARFVIGADGSSGMSARYVGVRFEQVDLGLEVELPVGSSRQREWQGRLLIDWGPIPGSYGWVFPKGDLLTVGVIAGRGQGDETKRYLRRFVERLGMSGIEPVQDSGHLTRCRAESSPLRRGRVLVAGDAAGLLEPWTREGISFALRSGALAGAAAAAGDPEGYVAAVAQTLSPSMRAGRRLHRAFSAHPAPFHALLATWPGWRLFARFCRGEADFDALVNRLPVRVALALLG